MRFTEYGVRLADDEEPFNMALLNGQQDTHREMLRRVDRDKLILLTNGQDDSGPDLRIFTHSVIAAFAHAETNSRIKFAWHLRGDGTRRLVFRS